MGIGHINDSELRIIDMHPSAGRGRQNCRHRDRQESRPMEIPHNMGGSLAGDFQPSAACKTLDYPPGNLRFLQATAD